MSMSTVSTSSEFRYSDLSRPIQENPLSQQDEDTAIARQISTTINVFSLSELQQAVLVLCCFLDFAFLRRKNSVSIELFFVWTFQEVVF